MVCERTMPTGLPAVWQTYEGDALMDDNTRTFRVTTIVAGEMVVRDMLVPTNFTAELMMAMCRVCDEVVNRAFEERGNPTRGKTISVLEVGGGSGKEVEVH